MLVTLPFSINQQLKKKKARLTPTKFMASMTMWILIGFEVQLPSLIYDPTIVEDPKKTPTVFFLDTNKIPSIVSFYHLKELPKNFLSNHVLWFHICHG